MRFSPSFDSLTEPAAQIIDHIVHGLSHVFRHDILGAHIGRLVLHDVGQDLASGTQRLTTQGFGHSQQSWSIQEEQTAAK